MPKPSPSASVPCSCHEIAGDNPNCSIHGNPRPVSREEARRFQKGRICCSDCFGTITTTFRWNPETNETEDTATCGTPACPMRGFVSLRYVEKQEQNQLVERREAKRLLTGHVTWLPKKQATPTDLLKELGF